MLLPLTTSLLFAGAALAAPFELIEERQSSCPKIHIFGARETTVPPAGYGSAGTVVNLILNAHSGSTSEAISYPAAGGNSYGAVTSFHTKCPSAQLVFVGYSQGGQIFDDAVCGGGDPNEGLTNTAVPLSSAILAQVKAVILMGDPRHVPGSSYNVGTSTAGGFDARPAGFSCPSASKIQLYCDASDPYCSNGNNAATHQGYGSEYGQAALKFVNSKLSA